MKTSATMSLTLATVAASLFSSTASAGDFATLNPIGFSADGGVFAYEQYGVQDGSGFPYADIFFLDLDADRFVAPSPVRIRLEEDGAGVETARARAREQAAGLFDLYRVEENPGSIVASNPATELSADPYRIRFLPRAIEPSPDEPIELRLEPIPMAASESCMGFEPVMGYRLTKIATVPGETADLIHEDGSIPESRDCPLDYRLSRIVVHGESTGGMRAVALVGVKSVGFEGPDLRFIANPVPLD